MGANAKKRREAASSADLTRQQKIDAVAPRGGGVNRIAAATVLAILAISLIVGGVIWNSTKEGSTTKTATGSLPKGVSGMGGPVQAYAAATPVAKAPTLDVYEDFQCPACQSFEGVLGSTVEELAQAGKVKVNYHPMTFIDENVKNDASARSTTGALCAADQGKFEAFHGQVFAHPPAKEGDGWTDEQLAGFAKDAGVDTTAWKTCTASKKYDAYVDALQTQTAKDGITSTPTLKLNGTKMNLAGMTPETFTKAVADATT